MELKVLKDCFTVCKLQPEAQLPLESDFCFIGKTDEELSLVCPTACTPAATLEREDGWRGFRIDGVLDFSLIGILAELSAVLAAKRIGIFVVSTYNTDYIFVKQAQFEDARNALVQSGYAIS